MTDWNTRGTDESWSPVPTELTATFAEAVGEGLESLAQAIDRHVAATQQLVTSGPSNGGRTVDALVGTLEENNCLRKSLRLAAMHTLRAQWSGFDAAPSQSASFQGAIDVQVSLLRTAEELLRYWATLQQPSDWRSVPTRWAPWLQARPALTPVANVRSTERLRTSRSRAALVRSSAPDEELGADSLLDHRWTELFEIKSAALQVAGGMSALVRGSLSSEGLEAFEITEDALGALVAAVIESRPFSAPPPRVAPTAARPRVSIDHVLRALRSLPVRTEGWETFVASLGDTCSIDWMPRPTKRPTSCCLPLDEGSSHIITSFYGSPTSVLSLFHELAHAYLYWRVRDTPEVLRPRRGVDETIALCIELDLTVAWIQTDPEVVALAEVASIRWSNLLEGSAHRLRAELDLLSFCTHEGRLSKPSLTEQSVRAMFYSEDVILNTHLVDGELQSARYLVGAAAAITCWAARVTDDLVGELASAGRPNAELRAVVADACRVSLLPAHAARLAALWGP